MVLVGRSAPPPTTAGAQRTRPTFSWASTLFPTPLGSTYPERRHRGQVHFRGAGYYLVSRQDACSRQGFSTGIMAHPARVHAFPGKAEAKPTTSNSAPVSLSLPSQSLTPTEDS